MAAFPWIAAASIGSDFLGSLLSYDAQKSANRSNIALGRETNALNEKMFNTSLDFQREMWQKTNQWNSPENQAKLLREAGFNPAMLFGQGGQALASSPAGVHGSASTFNPVTPADALGRGLSSAGIDVANTYLALSQAEKAKEESIGVATENKYKAATLSQNLALGGKDLEAKELYNEFQRKTLDTRIENSKLQNGFLSEQTNNLIADTAIKQITKKLESAKVRLTNKQIKELDSVIKKNMAEADYFVSAKDLNKIGISEAASRIVLNYVNAEMSKLVGSAQVGFYNASAHNQYSQAGLADETAWGAHIINQFNKQYGNTERIFSLAESLSRMNVNTASIDEIRAKCKAIGIDATNKQLDLMKRLVDMTTGRGILSDMLQSLGPALYAIPFLK